MGNENIEEIIKILKKEVKRWTIPAVGRVAKRYKDPFTILVSCILSLRTKDKVTFEASERLLSLAKTPKEMAMVDCSTIEQAIYPVGFYRVKARNIITLSRYIVDHYDSQVPKDIDNLLKLKGVGRKTANLVLSIGYGKAAICVDTHVYRISNRLGLVKTKTALETEMALQKRLPKVYWGIYNDLLVPFGQNVCTPVSPFCTRCPINTYCPKVGVTKSR